MALVGVELQTLVSEPDALTTRLPPCANFVKSQNGVRNVMYFILITEKNAKEYCFCGMKEKWVKIFDIINKNCVINKIYLFIMRN